MKFRKDSSCHPMRMCINVLYVPQVARQLSVKRGWSESKGPSADVLFSRRADVPWASLGSLGQPKCANHVRGTKHITIKALMTQTLASHNVEKGIALDMPASFLIVPAKVCCQCFIQTCQCMARIPHVPVCPHGACDGHLVTAIRSPPFPQCATMSGSTLHVFDLQAALFLVGRCGTCA